MEERFYYCQLDQDNIVVCVSNLSGEVIAPNMIRIDSEDSSLLGKIWDSKKKVFIDNPNVIEEKTISNSGFRSRFTTQELSALYESNDVISSILLDDMKINVMFDLLDSSLIEKLDHLVSIGLLTEERKLKILE